MTQHEDYTPEGVEPSAESAEGSEGVTNAPALRPISRKAT